MPDKPNTLTQEVPTLAVPGVLSVSIAPSGRKLVRVGPATGWSATAGIMDWERELSFVARADMTADLARSLHATLPQEQIARARFPLAFKAVEASPLLAIAGNLVEAARKLGVRVHTVGVDRVSGDFFYFAEGGSGEPVSVQGNLVEMLAPSLTASSTNADIEALLEGLVDRMLTSLSGGVVTELGVALADALPRLSRDGTGLEGTDIEAFDAEARALADRSAPHAEAAQALAAAVEAADRAGGKAAYAVVFGEAVMDADSPLALEVGGHPLQLPARGRWFATGVVRAETQAKATKVEAAPKVAESPKAAAARADVRKPAESPKPVEAAKPPAKPVEAATSAEPTKPPEVAKPAADARPVEVAKPIEAAKPAEVARPVEAAKPATAKSVEGSSTAAAPAKAAPLPKEEARAASAKTETVTPKPAAAGAPDAPTAAAAAPDAPAPAAASESSGAPAVAEASPPPPRQESPEAPASEPESGAFPEAPAPRASRRPARRRSLRPRAAAAKSPQPERAVKGSPIVKTLLFVAFAVTLYLSLMSALSAR